MSRQADLDRLYHLFEILEKRVMGMRRLQSCTGHMNWPDRGVYFFFATNETQEDTDYLRLTRIGTHEASFGTDASLWRRLRTHRGPKKGPYQGGGNHRDSIFRKHVGEAMIQQDDLHTDHPHWGKSARIPDEKRYAEQDHEKRVSNYIRNLPFLWVKVDDQPGPKSDRKYIKQNAIALVSNYQKKSIDQRNEDWLGNDSSCRKIRNSGLWNINHIDDQYEPAFLDRLDKAISDTQPL
jgi:hypothetical protein